MSRKSSHVWIEVSPGRKKRVPREEAVGNGASFEEPGGDDAPVAGFLPDGNTYRLTPEERERIYLQTGVHVEDYAHFKRVQKERGWRDIEKGEPGDLHRKAILDWVNGGERGAPPVPHTSLGPPPPPPKVDMQRLKYELIRSGRLRPR